MNINDVENFSLDLFKENVTVSVSADYSPIDKESDAFTCEKSRITTFLDYIIEPLKTYKTYFIGPIQYKTVKPRYARLRNMILMALGFLFLCVVVAFFQGQMDLIWNPLVLPGMLIFILAIFIPFGFRQERINKLMLKLQRNSKTAVAKKTEINSLIRSLFHTKSRNKSFRVTYTFKDHNGNSHSVIGIYRVSQKDLIPENATVVYNPYRIFENLVLIGEPHEFEWIKE